MLDDFKKFILRGNVLDLAVGVIIGGAFGAIAKSLVDDVIMPPLGMLGGHDDMANLFVVLKEGTKAPGPYPSVELAKAAGAVTLRYGIFLNTVVTFLLVATAMFLVVKLISKIYAAPPPPGTKDCPKCLSAIPEKAVKCGHCTADLV